MFDIDKFLGIAHPPDDPESLLRSEIRLTLNKLREDPADYMDRYGIMYADPKAAMIALDPALTRRIKVLEIELARITSMAEHLPDVPSTSGFHIRDFWSYFKAFFVDRFPYNVHPVSAADKIDTHEGKGDAQEQPVVVQEFKSYPRVAAITEVVFFFLGQCAGTASVLLGSMWAVGVFGRYSSPSGRFARYTAGGLMRSAHAARASLWEE
ncbi:hypothetical protein PILCRDRAFT_86562 [Piloderma croceum F 1598]|uniref:Uncharacterized protein n=1 Tax=Piloderma croceum (strain F 1598) TaxID=765440 RepID=A0A0C3C9J2_PILCF|nr:hypothetical protein PILCRDRAFT_86562 [Piloderma croceum F 1598]